MPSPSIVKSYLRINLELWAITDAVQKWRHYLWGNEFTIRTDHRSLKNLVAQIIQTLEQQFFFTKLLGVQV